jgi:hypothetical protein
MLLLLAAPTVHAIAMSSEALLKTACLPTVMMMLTDAQLPIVIVLPTAMSTVMPSYALLPAVIVLMTTLSTLLVLLVL